MKCWSVANNQLELIQAKIPTPRSGYHIVKVKAFGVNRADLLQLQGIYPSPDKSTVLGMEVSGEIVETGEEICALVSSGAYAEYVLVPQNQIIPIPKNYNSIEAAALPEALITVGLNLFKIAKITSGKTVLIHGATSGIGNFAIKLARAVGARVYSSVGSDDKIEKCTEAEFTFNYKSDWVDEIKSRGGVDVILDILGGEHMEKNISALNPKGTIVSIAVMDGSKANINLASVLMKNLTIVGSTLRSKTNSQKAQLIKYTIDKLLPILESKRIKPTIDSVYDFNDTPKALDRMISRKHVGKIVIEIK